MPKTIALGKEALLLLKDDVSIDRISVVFVIAHGELSEKKFISDIELYFPWGLTNFGWYESDSGFPLYRIYRNYRQGIPEGLTSPTSLTVESLPTPGSLLNSLQTPLLTRTTREVPNIDLVPKDLDKNFCETMLRDYYTNTPADDAGILCLKSKSTLADVLIHLKLCLKANHNYSDVVAICLCCSVAVGDEHNAMNRAEGYKML